MPIFCASWQAWQVTRFGTQAGLRDLRPQKLQTSVFGNQASLRDLVIYCFWVSSESANDLTETNPSNFTCHEALVASSSVRSDMAVGHLNDNDLGLINTGKDICIAKWSNFELTNPTNLVPLDPNSPMHVAFAAGRTLNNPGSTSNNHI